MKNYRLLNELFDQKDLLEIAHRDIKPEMILSQIEMFQQGIPSVNLKKTCLIGDGITTIPSSEFEELEERYQYAVSIGRVSKFIPASGAATRMFKTLLAFKKNIASLKENGLIRELGKSNKNYQPFSHFITNIKRFAFYQDLIPFLNNRQFNLEHLTVKNSQKILDCLLTSDGLNYMNLPKGLIKFHCYSEYCCSAFEEHLKEALLYTKDKDGISRIHFTISPEHEHQIKHYMKNLQETYKEKGLFQISYSFQKLSTNTIAVDFQNKPFRDKNKHLCFHPGGHGALLENLNELRGDIVFIKNIDNVVPDHLKSETCKYKILLGGYLIKLQHQIFTYLRKLANQTIDAYMLQEVSHFAEKRLCIAFTDDFQNKSTQDKTQFLFSCLNRPLRVCGMVKNQGEPGGGPFWIEKNNQLATLQIVESAQVNMNSSTQKDIWEASTHFNPVDIVCGIKDYQGNSFDLSKFSDPYSCFIAEKFKNGQELKILELPGLWNGAMADWNTVFVEVPLITFNPVKTVFDLLRNEHQPG